MKLATVPSNGCPDGELVVVSTDLKRAVRVTGIPTLQALLELWPVVGDRLERVAAALQTGRAEGAFDFDPLTALAPMPRAWQWLDGSAFESHGELMARVFGRVHEKRTRPLMYQGVSDRFYAPAEDVPFRSEDDGIDFEGEFGIITDRVPMGVTPKQAREHIRLVVLINDWSLRTLSPIEMKTGFGWVQAKPPCSIAPVAVTPDELGEAWRNARVALPLRVDWNGRRVGEANGEAMSFGFDELVAHAAATRSLVAGTIIGSGTVSNSNYREVGSSCIAERRGIEVIDTGEPRTGFLRFGDRVRMEAFDTHGATVFGAIDQRVVPV